MFDPTIVSLVCIAPRKQTNKLTKKRVGTQQTALSPEQLSCSSKRANQWAATFNTHFQLAWQTTYPFKKSYSPSKYAIYCTVCSNGVFHYGHQGETPEATVRKLSTRVKKVLRWQVISVILGQT